MERTEYPTNFEASEPLCIEISMTHYEYINLEPKWYQKLFDTKWKKQRRKELMEIREADREHIKPVTISSTFCSKDFD